VAIEILAGSVIPHRGARVGAAIWTSRKSTPASKLVVTRVICTRSREMPGQTPFTEWGTWATYGQKAHRRRKVSIQGVAWWSCCATRR